MKELILFIGLVINNLYPLDNVYDRDRLYLLDPYKKVTGVVKKISPELDGDIHIRLMVDDFNLLIKNNFKHEDSCLVLEIVCVNKSIFKKCKNYVNLIRIPNIGDTITVSGPYVLDRRHKIREIHPVEQLSFVGQQ